MHVTATDFFERLSAYVATLVSAIASAGSPSAGGRQLADAILDTEYRHALPVTAAGDVTSTWSFGSLEVAACDGVSVGYSGPSIQLAGDLRGRSPVLRDEHFNNPAAWKAGANWSFSGGAAVGATASTSVTQANVLRVGERYLVVFGITNASGTVTPYCGTTAGTARGTGGVTAKVYAEVIVCAANGTFALTGSSFVGSIPFALAFPLSAPMPSNVAVPRDYRRLCAAVVSGSIVSLASTAGQGVWVSRMRT